MCTSIRTVLFCNDSRLHKSKCGEVSSRAQPGRCNVQQRYFEYGLYRSIGHEDEATPGLNEVCIHYILYMYMYAWQTGKQERRQVWRHGVRQAGMHTGTHLVMQADSTQVGRQAARYARRKAGTQACRKASR